MEKIIDFSNIVNLKQFSDLYCQLDDNYLFCHVRRSTTPLSELIDTSPMKVSGTMLILLRSGDDVVIEVNLEKQVVHPGDLIFIFPGNLVRTIGRVSDNIDAYVLYCDSAFARSVNINLTSISIPATIQKPRATMRLEEDEASLMVRYFMLLHAATVEDSNNDRIIKSIASSITSAIFYQIVYFYHKRLPGEIARQTAPISGSSRRHDYVREFIRLVHLHYVRERSVAFYADKLFISPKYLSLLVKEATGRSAASWIDEFVLMEAKNLLRFSGKNIQQVAYSLNFPTQSSFGKYFKHLTGISPSEYQKN